MAKKRGESSKPAGRGGQAGPRRRRHPAQGNSAPVWQSQWWYLQYRGELPRPRAEAGGRSLVGGRAESFV